MIQPRETPGGEPRLHSIGCAGRLMAFSETEDGRYMITLAGVSRFRILEELQGFTPYRRMRVDWSPFPRDWGRPRPIRGLRPGGAVLAAGAVLR
jgi:Lon protease-like protein